MVNAYPLEGVSLPVGSLYGLQVNPHWIETVSDGLIESLVLTVEQALTVPGDARASGLQAHDRKVFSP